MHRVATRSVKNCSKSMRFDTICSATLLFIKVFISDHIESAIEKKALIRFVKSAFILEGQANCSRLGKAR